MPIHPKVCTVLYFVSCILDAVDGQAARALGQTSKFGAVLDMVTDRSVNLPFSGSSPAVRGGFARDDRLPRGRTPRR